MVYVKKQSNRLPREVIKAKFIRMNTDEQGVVNEAEKKFRYVDALFMKLDDKGEMLYQKNEKGEVILSEDGTPKPEWLSVRIYPTDKDKNATSLNSFPELVKAEELADFEAKKEKNVERNFPLVQFEAYKKLAEVNGKIYKNYKISLDDLPKFKVL